MQSQAACPFASRTLKWISHTCLIPKHAYFVGKVAIYALLLSATRYRLCQIHEAGTSQKVICNTPYGHVMP